MHSPESTSIVRLWLLVALLVVACAAGATTAAAHPAAWIGQADCTSSNHATTDARNHTVTVHRGDVVDVALSVGNATDAVVHVSSGDSIYRANVSVADTDGDGRVVLRWNTYLAGHGDAFDAAGEDAATVEGETPVDGRVPPGRYDVTVTAGGERVDAATVNLTAAPAQSLRSLTSVPGRNVTLATPGDIRAAELSGDLRTSKRAWLRGVLVLELRAPGIGGALAAQDGPNASARFESLIATDGFAFSFVQDWRTVSTMEEPMRLQLTGRGVQVLADPANDTYHLLVDVDRARFDNQDGRLHDHDTGDWFDANFTLGPGSDLVEERRTATVEKVVVSWPGVELDGPPESLVHPRRNQRLVADTNLPTGTAVTVHVSVLGSGFERRLSVPVTGGPDGNHVNATLNLSTLSAGTKLRVRYFFDDREVGAGFRDQFETVVVTGAEYRLTVTGTDGTGEPQAPAAVTVNATLGEFGYVVLHADSARGRVLGASRLLEPGTYTNLTVERSTSLRDTERVVVVLHHYRGEHGQEYAGDPAVVLNGSQVAVPVAVPPEPTATPSATATPDPTTNSPTPSSTLTDTPGFGVALALLALAAAPAILRRLG